MRAHDELAASYAAGASVAELAQRFDVTPKTVRARLTRAGVPPRRRGRPVQFPQLENPAWLRGEYVDRSRTAADIARALGCSETAVLDALRRHALPVRDRGGGSRRAAMPGELTDSRWLMRRYATDGASIRRIAAELGVSASAVAGRCAVPVSPDGRSATSGRQSPGRRNRWCQHRAAMVGDPSGYWPMAPSTSRRWGGWSSSTTDAASSATCALRRCGCCRHRICDVMAGRRRSIGRRSV